MDEPAIEVGPVQTHEIDAVCAFLEQNMHRGMAGEEYKRLFSYDWLRDKPNRGFVMKDGGKIVGFLGAVYAERAIDGREERFCNLTNWCVLPAYRYASLSLLFAILKDPAQTVINLSPTEEVQKMLAALRFRVLDTFKLFTGPFTHAATLFASPRPTIESDRAVLLERLSSDDRQLYEDHEATKCGHLMLALPDEYSYVIFKRRKKNGIAFSELLYVRNPALLRRHFERAKLHIFGKDRTCLLAVDERLLGGRPRLVWPYKRVSMFRSRTVRADKIDNLYSELALL
jgi:acetoacetyl-CoA synthetase